MVRFKTFLLSFLIAALSIVFISGCSTDTPGDNLGGGSGTGITPIDLTNEPFSLLGVYQVDLYGIDGEPVNTPTQKSELRVGLNLTTAADGANAPEVIMLLNFDGQVIPFNTHIIDLSSMQGDLNSFISKTFTDLGAELITGDQYSLYFTLDPAKNTQYQPLIDKNVITSGQYLKLKLTKTKDLQADAGLTTSDDVVDPSLEVQDINFDKTVHKITDKGSFTVGTFFAPVGATSTLTWETDNPQVATVENGVVTILSNGNATITATTANGKTATLEIKEAVLGEISLDKNELTLYVNNDGTEAQTHQLVLSGVPDILGATVTYETNNGETVVSVDQNGLVTAKAVGSDVITVRVNANGVEKTATCNVKVENFPEGIVFEKFEYGVALGSTIQIKPYLLGTTTYAEPVTYSVNKEGIISIDNQGNISTISKGDVEVTATYSMAGQQYTATCTVSVYTPANLNDLQSMQGTYEIVDFSQKSSMLSSGTTDGVNNVQRMIGEVTIEIVNGQAVVKSKIQMNSDELYNFGLSQAHDGLFSVTNFENMNYSNNELISPSYKESLGWFESGNQNAGKLTLVGGDKFVIKQFFKQVVEVTVNTYIVKKSDTVKELTNNRYFDYMDFAKTQTSHAKLKGKGQDVLEGMEAYYSYGVRTYN